MPEAVVTEYVELCERIAAEALFSEGAEDKLYDRLDRLWYVEMSAEDRALAQDRLRSKAEAWGAIRRTGEDGP